MSRIIEDSLVCETMESHDPILGINESTIWLDIAKQIRKWVSCLRQGVINAKYEAFDVKFYWISGAVSKILVFR